MTKNSINANSLLKLAFKVTAIGVTLVLATYSLVWFLLSTLQLIMEGIIN